MAPPLAYSAGVTLVPVLLYHSVSSQPHPLIRDFSVDEERFAADLDAIVALGLEALTVSQLVQALRDDDTERLGRAVAITFDDGFADVFSAALPALVARGLVASVFVTTGLLGGGGSKPLDSSLSEHMLSFSQLLELQEAGFEIGAHSHSHPQLDTLTRPRLREELVRPRALLEDVLSAPVPGVAYPHGYSGPVVRRLAAEAGYEYGCGVGQTFTGQREDRFSISRLMLTSSHTPEAVAEWLEHRGAPGPRRGDRVRTRAWRLYRRNRAIIRGIPGADPGWPGSRLPR